MNNAPLGFMHFGRFYMLTAIKCVENYVHEDGNRFMIITFIDKEDLRIEREAHETLYLELQSLFGFDRSPAWQSNVRIA